MSELPPRDDVPVTQDHRRQWRQCRYVYPVIARRSRGVSVGVNLNPDKRCNFACLYCQINRRIRRDLTGVDIPRLADELELALTETLSGAIFSEPRFLRTPKAMRRVNDIAFSGDGEPTCLPNFDAAVAAGAEARTRHHADAVKLVVITNASQLDQPPLQRALEILDANNGEIWAKLDAGTEAYFQRVNRPHPRIALAKIVADITAVATGRPVVIQTLFCRLDGQDPPPEEIAAYAGQLRSILDAGGQLRLIQLHTVARPPADAAVAMLPDEQLDAIGRQVQAAVGDVPVEVYYGADVAGQQDSAD